MFNVSVISDIHANSIALEKSLSMFKEQKIEHLIILGDLLTYGVDVEKTLDLVEQQINNGAVLILGNHDSLYLDLINNDFIYYNKLQDWIKESVDFTLQKLDTKRFSSLPWKSSIVRDNIFYSHANPYGDWSYLNSKEDLLKASDVLIKHNYIAGVFGHTHRSICFSMEDKLWILNPGSIGQPRSSTNSSMLNLLSDKNKLYTEICPVIYDVDKHIENIVSSSLSITTKNKLISFFKRTTYG
jgi:predicted phosphodiesterase